MSVKSCLRRLEAGVEWLETDGMFRHLEIMFKIIEMKQEIADNLACNKETADRFERAGLLRTLDLPPPSWAARPAEPAPPHPEEPRETRRLEGSEPAPRSQPILRDATLRAAPQDEGVRVEPRVVATPPPPTKPPPPEPPAPPPFHYDPPPEMQIRPVTWRRRGPQDDEDDGEDMYGRCIVDYDPLAEEDADYED